ncbi:Rho-binding antiterminator [Thiolapillus sp.]
MEEDSYIPIDCGLHSEYELLAMHRRRVILRFDAGKEMRELEGKVVDVLTRNQAEYLRLLLEEGGTLDIRLDKIREISA